MLIKVFAVLMLAISGFIGLIFLLGIMAVVILITERLRKWVRLK